MSDEWLAKVPGIRDIIDDTEGGAVLLPRDTTLVLKGAVVITPTARGIELEFTGGPGGGDGSGDVVGPASATANRVAVFADPTGKLLADSGVPYTALIRSTGAVAFAADQSMGGNKLTNLANGASSGDALPKSQIETLIASAIAGAGGGGGDGFAFTFSTTTTDADPGAGTLRFNSATPASVTQIFVDLADTSSNDITAWLDRLDDSVGSVKGYVRVGSKNDKTKWLLFSLASVTTATGYRKLGVTHVAGSALPLTTAGDCFLSFESMGIIGTLPWSQLATAIGNLGFTGLKSLAYSGEYDNAALGATPTITWTNGDLQKGTLSANATLTFSAPAGVGLVQLCIIQDSTPRTVTWPGSVQGTPPQPSTVNGSKNYYTFFYDGTNYVYQTIAHNDLTGLTTGDPHTQYALVNGTRAFTGGVTVTQAAVSGGTPAALRVTGGAHTASIASTELVDVDLALNRTVQFSTGSLTTQRAVLVRAPTYSFVGASVITDAATLSITGAPVAGTNATITNRWAMLIESGNVRVAFSHVLYGVAQAGGGAKFKLLEWGVGGAADNLGIGDGSNTSTQLFTGGSFNFIVGVSEKLRVTSALVQVRVASLAFVAAGLTSPTISQEADAAASAVGQPLFFNSQDATGTGGTGGAMNRRAGDAQGASGTRTGGNLYDRPGKGTTANGNWGWFVQSTDSVNFQSMQGGIYCKNADVVPSGNPSGGGFLYVEAGALKYRGSGGTITTLGAA